MIKVRVKDNNVELINDSNIIVRGEKLKIIKNKYKITLRIDCCKNEHKYNDRMFYIDIVFDVNGKPAIMIETDRGNCYKIPEEAVFYIYNVSIEVDRIVEETNKNQYEDEEDNDSCDCYDNDYDDDDNDDNYDEEDDDECD